MLKTKCSFIFDEDIFSKSEINEIVKNKLHLKKEIIIDYKELDYSIYTTTLENTNSMMDITGNIMSIFSEFNKTRELKRRINNQKKALDSMVNEARYRSNVELVEYEIRKKLEFEHVKRELEIYLEKVRKEAEVNKKRLNLDFKEIRKKKEIMIKSREVIKQSLDLTKEIIDKASENKINKKYYAQINEQYKETLNEYNKLIKNYVRR